MAATGRDHHPLQGIEMTREYDVLLHTVQLLTPQLHNLA